MDLKEIQKRIDDVKQRNPQVEADMADAIRFANDNLRGRSPAFCGALLGLLVGATFAQQSLANFDVWCQLIRKDLESRKQQEPSRQ
ncbi:MAG TPA: hypothetical protein VHA37_01925 [Candidatus Saccharimonadales bacterium]|nr:hypothetical protein [Candidatus Saccharimonadales bacterium]